MLPFQATRFLKIRCVFDIEHTSSWDNVKVLQARSVFKQRDFSALDAIKNAYFWTLAIFVTNNDVIHPFKFKVLSDEEFLQN